MQTDLVDEKLFTDYNSEVSREEMAMFIHMGFEEIIGDHYYPENIKNPFSDVDKSQYKSEILAAYNLNLINGIGGGKFNPEEKVTRQEAYTMMYNLLQLIAPNKDLTVKNDVTFKDDVDSCMGKAFCIVYVQK